MPVKPLARTLLTLTNSLTCRQRSRSCKTACVAPRTVCGKVRRPLLLRLLSRCVWHLLLTMHVCTAGLCTVLFGTQHKLSCKTWQLAFLHAHLVASPAHCLAKLLLPPPPVATPYTLLGAEQLDPVQRVILPPASSSQNAHPITHVGLCRLRSRSSRHLAFPGARQH